jgi:hypothetical protein
MPNLTLTERGVIREALGERYVVARPIATGGMAEVFAARDLRHDRRVAIKIVRQDCATHELDDRFERGSGNGVS